MLILKALGTSPALGTTGSTGTGHMLSHPGELQVAHVVKLVQLNRGLQLHVLGSQVALQGLKSEEREKRVKQVRTR